MKSHRKFLFFAQTAAEVKANTLAEAKRKALVYRNLAEENEAMADLYEKRLARFRKEGIGTEETEINAIDYRAAAEYNGALADMYESRAARLTQPTEEQDNAEQMD